MRGLAVAVAVLSAAVSATGGEIHRWVDERGVVHFADVPPPNVRTETRTMADRPPVAAAEPAPALPPGSTPAPATASANRPAQVVVTGQQSEPLGDTRYAVHGTVENKGGAPARGVIVAVRVVSPAQGDHCLDDEIDVRPSTLAPGEKGEFTADLDHPCFRGPTQVSVRAEWD